MTENSLWHRHILPFVTLTTLLAVVTLAGDYVLHRFNLIWVGRYLGIPGTLLIIFSLVYSLRKRKLISSSTPKTWLNRHEFCAWLGSAMVLVHAGIHLNAILPWLATVAMSVNVISGLVGKLLLGRAREHMQLTRAQYEARGLTPAQIEQKVFWDAVAVDTMKQWRTVHFPITAAFTVLALAHIASTLLLWGWR